MRSGGNGSMQRSPIELVRVAQTVATLRHLATAAPLAMARCWHRPRPRTSQRDAIQRALSPGLTSALLIGGNRSSKTTAGAMIAVAYALGRNHPHVVAWAAANGIDVSVIQEGPGRVCASALTASDSRSVQRAKVAEFIPAQHRWMNRDGNGEARCVFPSGGSIVFKSNDAGARRFQGDAWDLFWADEEHDEAVYQEARMRLIDRSGRALLTMTPLLGRTWVWRRFLDQAEPQTALYALHSGDNPHIPREYLDALLAQYGPHERAARARGEFLTLEGRVYEDFRRDLHVIPSRPIPVSWPRYQAWDFGTRNPTAILWTAIDPADDTLHVYREHYRSGWTIRQHADHVNQIERCPCGSSCPACQLHPGRTEPEPRWRVADSAARGDRQTLAREHNISTVKSPKAIRPGINSVAERIRPNAEGRPAMLIHDCCANTIREIEGYVWHVTRSKTDGPDMPLKANDHAMDALRYLCHRMARSRQSGASA